MYVNLTKFVETENLKMRNSVILDQFIQRNTANLTVVISKRGIITVQQLTISLPVILDVATIFDKETKPVILDFLKEMRGATQPAKFKQSINALDQVLSHVSQTAGMESWSRGKHVMMDLLTLAALRIVRM